MPASRKIVRAIVLLLTSGLALLLLPTVAVAQSPPLIPTSVRVTAGDASAVVTWVEPDSDGGNTISSYTVTSTPSGIAATVPGVARSATMAGLTNGVAYRFSVTASNRTGTGPASAVSNVVTPTPAAATPGVAVIHENFATPAADMAAVGAGTWAVSSGRYTLAAPADEGVQVANANLSVHNAVVTGDFTVTASGSTTSTDSPFNDFSLVFGYQDPSNYYFASFSEGNDANTSGIFKVTDGTRTELADISASIVAGTIYPVRIEREGAAIRAYRSAEQVASANDATFTSGKVGFGSRNDGGTFDDLVVTVPPVSPAATPETPKGFFARLWERLASPFSG